jgi:MoaA/NifB/PqqE/SkfB family radical SAM enzyme
LGSSLARTWDLLKLVPRGGPALCNIAVTNACNATCDFCNFAYDKERTGPLRWIDVRRFDEALAILHGRDIRYVSFFGGETLLHPRLPEMIAMAVARGMVPALITNGWLLSAKLDKLAAAGLKTVYISIDSADIATHEANRGLKGLGGRIRAATARMPELGMMPLAQVTMSKLISDYHTLVPALRDLGFTSVTFSYPQRAALGSSSLAWSNESKLVAYSDSELADTFDAASALRSEFPVNNPRASMEDMKRHVRGEEETFVCYGGFKSFYMDWNYDVWRCDAWARPMCSVWDFADTPLIRDGCTACIADCYRDSSVMLHFAVALSDALDQLRGGQVLKALQTLANRRNLVSLGAIMDNAAIQSHMAHGQKVKAQPPAQASVRTSRTAEISERAVAMPRGNVGREQDERQGERDDQSHAQRVVANGNSYAPADGEADTHRANHFEKRPDRARISHRDGSQHPDRPADGHRHRQPVGQIGDQPARQ